MRIRRSRKHSRRKNFERAMTRTQTFWNSIYWLDLGNNADSGQFVMGQLENSRNKSVVLRLPTAAELFPELADPKLDLKDTLLLQCS